MRVTKQFQPITITLEQEQEARIIEDALNLLIQDTMKRGGSRWFGFKDRQLSGQEMEYRSLVKRILVSINPDYKQSPLFVTEWS